MNISKKIYFSITFLFFSLVGYILFRDVLRLPFLSDDWVLLEKVRTSSYSSLFTGKIMPEFYRPLALLSIATDLKFWSLNPAPFHDFNVVIHLLNSLFVTILFFQLYQKENLGFYGSMAAGLLFLIHPSHVEAVTWISGRFDLLATLFSLTSISCYLLYLRTHRISFFVLALTLFCGALFSKESSLIVPLIWLVLEVYFYKRVTHFLSYLIGLILICSYFVIRVNILGTLLPSIIGGISLKAFIGRPVQLAFRSIFPSLIFSAYVVTLIFAFMLAIGLSLYANGRKSFTDRFLIMLFILFAISLIPVWNLSVNIINGSGERYIYLPSIFSLISVCYIMFDKLNAKIFCLFAVIVIVYFAATVVSNNQWQKAGRLSNRILHGVNDIRDSNLVIVNLPESIRGAYVFRNGFLEALKVSGIFHERVSVLATHTLTEENEIVNFEKSEAGYRFTLIKGSEWTQLWDDNNCSARMENARTIVVPDSNCFSDLSVIYFSKESLNRL